VLDAAEMARAGERTASEIVDVLNEKKEKLDVSFVLDTLEFLKAGGRCSSLAAFGANLLSLKPSIEVKNGTMGVGKKYRGKIVAAYKQYITDRLKGRDDIDTKRIFITDSGIDESIRRELHELVASLQPFEEILHTQAGCTISQHCGPGCMGILYYHK
jgi:DegV family protein with EDD domain